MYTVDNNTDVINFADAMKLQIDSFRSQLTSSSAQLGHRSYALKIMRDSHTLIDRVLKAVANDEPYIAINPHTSVARVISATPVNDLPHYCDAGEVCVNRMFFPSVIAVAAQRAFDACFIANGYSLAHKFKDESFTIHWQRMKSGETFKTNPMCDIKKAFRLLRRMPNSGDFKAAELRLTNSKAPRAVIAVRYGNNDWHFCKCATNPQQVWDYGTLVGEAWLCLQAFFAMSKERRAEVAAAAIDANHTVQHLIEQRAASKTA